MRFGAFRELGRCGLLRESFPKKLDWRRRLHNRFRPMIRESGIRGLIAGRVSLRTCALSRVRFLSSQFAP
jgi:hypothetical protein